MSVSRLKHITKIGVEQMGDLADAFADSDVLRLENLDSNLTPPKVALSETRKAIYEDDSNSYLPFLGKKELRKAIVNRIEKQTEHLYNWKEECIITAGGLNGILNVLLATLEEGDEVLLTDPTYAGLINRVRLAGGIPRFVSLIPEKEDWRLDIKQLKTISKDKIKMVLITNPSMPSGAVFNLNEWQAIADFCNDSEAWLLYNAAFEQILYDDLKVIHPASFKKLKHKVITVGSASKEFNMIGWRIGWVVGPKKIMTDIARVSISNVVCQSGIAMGAVTKALENKNDFLNENKQIWQEQRDFILQELKDYKIIVPRGGWSLLVDVSEFGMDSNAASSILLQRSKIATTPMVNWGTKKTSKYIRIVFSNESIERLKGLGKKFDYTFKNK